VQVEHRLPRGGAARLQHVHTCGAEILVGPSRELLRQQRTRGDILRIRRQQILGVYPRHDQAMPARCGRDVHERDRARVFVDDLRRDLSGTILQKRQSIIAGSISSAWTLLRDAE